MTTSNGIEPGQKAPPFNLPNANPRMDDDFDANISLSDDIGSNGIIILFTCNHCPYVVGSESRIEEMALKARENNIGFVGINSNDPVNYESDSWENMVKRASKRMSYHYLHDADQSIATIYGAKRTPEFYLVNSSGIVVYRGRLDDSPRDPSHATTTDLSDAIDSLIAGEPISQERTESIGCSVKWKI
jgi:peroxiredoxin